MTWDMKSAKFFFLLPDHSWHLSSIQANDSFMFGTDGESKPAS
jgi:hypothetical protein